MMATESYNRKSFLLLGSIYFFLGFAAVIVQSVLIREFLVIAHGNELILGTLFTVWFVWIAVGAGIGSPLLRKIRNPFPVFWVILIAGLILFPCQIAVIRLGRTVLSVPVGTFMSFTQAMFWSLICISPFSLMIGLTFPLGAHLHRNILPDRVKLVGYLYMFEAVGSLLGGVVFTFLLVNNFHAFQISNFLLIAAVVLMLFAGRSLLLHRKNNVMIVGVIVIGVLLGLFTNVLQRWSEKKRWIDIGGEKNQLVASLNTPYDHITIARIGDQYSLFQNGQLSFSFPDPYDYNIQANLVLTQHPDPNHLLVIGDGIHGLLPALLRHPDITIDWVLRDKELLEHLAPLLPETVRNKLNSYRVNVIFGDGRYHLQKQIAEYDIIYLDLPLPSTAVLNRYYTVEFFRDSKRALQSNGILSFQFSISDNYLGEEVSQFAASVYYSLKKVFNEVIITAGKENYFFASKQTAQLMTNPEKLVQRWEQRDVQESSFSPNAFYAFYLPERMSFLKNKLENVANPRLNTDNQPISYFYNLLLWSRFTGGDRILRTIWHTLNQLRMLYLIIFLVAILVFRMVWIVLKNKDSAAVQKWNSLASVTVSGFSAMALQIILLFGFQNLYGSLYQNVALLTAFFMFGLALGSWGLNRILPIIKQIVLFFIALEALLIIIALLLPNVFQVFGLRIIQLFGLVGSQILYLVLVLLVGVITGAVFPLAGKGMWEAGENVGGTASKVDAADHTGACIGAFLMGTFLIPVLGLQGSVLVVVLFNALAILFWVFSLGMSKILYSK